VISAGSVYGAARGLFFCSPLTIPSLIANSIMDSGRSVGGRADSSGTLRTTSSSSEVRDGAVDDIGGKSDNVKVCIRVRPLLGGESRSAWTHDDKSLVRACTQRACRTRVSEPVVNWARSATTVMSGVH
jgi:hypothetical protein